jgi:hypothetical protein
MADNFTVGFPVDELLSQSTLNPDGIARPGQHY